MKRLMYLLTALLLVGCEPSYIHSTIDNMLKVYPESRVADIYKSFCQDNLGPEHLIPDIETARSYLVEEIGTYRQDLADGLYPKPALRYFPTGDEGNYVRVDLSVVLDGIMTQEEFLDAFVRSANSGVKKDEDLWRAKWELIELCINEYFYDIPGAGKDMAQIDEQMSQGNMIIHHSEDFCKAYNPHYRIIAKDIFESEILPRITR